MATARDRRKRHGRPLGIDAAGVGAVTRALAAPDFRRHDDDALVNLRALHPAANFIRILGVNYVHLKTADEGDLYLTRWGVPYVHHLQPENWYEGEWFREHRQRLEGTSTVYRMPTRPVASHLTKSIEIVVKWSRVGQDLDLNTLTFDRNVNAQFNSPFEEFSLLKELRRGDYGPRELRILTQKPLAIYVPPERMQPWQAGRSREKLLAKAGRHPGVEIDVLRSYILIYAWVKGLNAVEAFRNSCVDHQRQKAELEALTRRADEELKKKGFLVVDHKPAHFIVRMKEGIVVRREDGTIPYALIDYELLSRTPENEDAVRSARRSEYLVRQRDRFLPRKVEEYPEQLRPCRVLRVDYVFGRCQSTNGILWVVGNDPDLFAYFLPERWRNPQVRMTDTAQTYYTQTKDRVHLVWRVSKVGELACGGEPEGARKRFLQGHNSPFEEFDLAMEMARRGVRAVYPRAIYMTFSPNQVAGRVHDHRAFKRLAEARSPEGTPAMPKGHDYILIWGYWRGMPDDAAVADDRLWAPIDLRQARLIGLVDGERAEAMLRRHEAGMRAAGFEDVNLKPDHVLLCHIPGGQIKVDECGEPETRHCNFEMMRRIVTRNATSPPQ